MDDSNKDGPSSDDKALLARLNALKPSPVRFDSQSLFSTPAYHSTDLAARFESLHVRHSPTSRPRVQPDSPRPRDESSPTLEELIAELECDEQFSLDDADVQEVDSVLQEAKRARRPRDADEGRKLSEEVADVNDKTGASSSSAARLLDGDPEIRGSEKYEDEDAEAASSLRRILDGLDIEESHAPTQRDTSTPASPQHISSFFPSPPKSLTTSPTATVPSPPPAPSPFFLPSPPTAPPSATSTPAGFSKSTSASPYTDAEISSWCAICCADATVRCRGCAGELYCWACWCEGHVGEDVGREERGHRWDKVGDMRRGVN